MQHHIVAAILCTLLISLLIHMPFLLKRCDIYIPKDATEVCVSLLSFSGHSFPINFFSAEIHIWEEIITTL